MLRRTMSLFLSSLFISHSYAMNYTNPVIRTNSPDPGVMLYDGIYYAVTTSGNAPDAFPIFSSNDLVHWTQTGSIFPAGRWPSWAVKDMWAPELHAVNGTIVAYFTGRTAAGVLSVGAAVADHPTGPFTDVGAPLVSEPSVPMGNIDPSYLKTSEGSFLLWKRDGNAVNQPTPLFIRPLVANGTAFVPGSKETELIRNTLPWEDMLVEAPWMVQHDDEYFLFYSANIMIHYSIGVARSKSPLGPFTKLETPVLSATTGSLVGPGHCSVLTTSDGSTVILYHTWKNDPPINFGVPRFTTLDTVRWNSVGSGGWPTVNNGAPGVLPEPVP